MFIDIRACNNTAPSPNTSFELTNMTSKPSLPFSEPPWLQGMPSPYYSDSHKRFQKYCRKFVDENLNENAFEWEEAGEVPAHVYQKFAAANMLIPNLPSPLPVKQLKDAGVHQIGEGEGAVKVEDWNYMHTLVYACEV